MSEEALDALIQRVEALEEKVGRIEKSARTGAVASRAEVAGAVPRFTVANLPATNVQPGAVALATDGRKAAEGPGAGTGVLVYYADAGGGADAWLRASDDSQVQA